MNYTLALKEWWYIHGWEDRIQYALSQRSLLYSAMSNSHSGLKFDDEIYAVNMKNIFWLVKFIPPISVQTIPPIFERKKPNQTKSFSLIIILFFHKFYYNI